MFPRAMTLPASASAASDAGRTVDASGARIPFVLDLASALHEAGHSTHQLEELLEGASRKLGIAGRFFATPTSIFATFGNNRMQQTYMIRTAPMAPDLGRLVRVTHVAQSVLRGDLSPAEGSDRLAQVTTSVPSGAIVLFANALASGAAARFLGGALPEIGVAAFAGFVTGLLALVAARLPQVARIYELGAAFVCAFVVAMLGALMGGFSVSIATLAGLIILVPGLTVTTAISELAMSHLTAGTTRMAGAFMTFIGIGFGVALGTQVAEQLAGPAPAVTPGTIAAATNWLALAGTGLAFSILLKAERADWGWILLAGVIAFSATRLGGGLLGPELGVFVGSLAVGLSSNLFNRITGRPAAVTMVPGLLTLVPGSIGFRSISALLESQVVAGIDTAFTMLFTAVSLVAGLLTAAALLPERPLS